MRWRGNRRSSNLEDNRSMGAGGFGGSGGGMLRLLPMVFRFLGFKGSAVFLAGVVGYGLFTGDLNGVLTGSSASQNVHAQTSEQRPLKETAEEKELVQFVSTVLADTEETWKALCNQMGMRYKAP